MIFTKLEIDVMQGNELSDSVDLAIKHRFPALVVHQGLAGDAIRLRGARRGRFRIITPVDWPKGEHFGTFKFRNMLLDSLEADGFEICLTGNKNAIETRNEAKAISDFVTNHIGELTEVRFVLGTTLFTEENIAAMCEGLKGVRTPTYLRNDTQVRLQVSKANANLHNALIDKILGTLSVPIKLSGNINGIKAVATCDRARRFAVNLSQARTIVKEFQSQPSQLHDLLGESADATQV